MSCNIEGSETIAAVVGRWDPSDLCLIERFEFVGSSESGDCYGSAVQITGLLQRRDTAGPWPTKDRPMHRVRIRFTGVRALVLRTSDVGPIQIMGFDIAKVSDRQLEDVRFQVDDYEDGKLSFGCRDAVVEIV